MANRIESTLVYNANLTQAIAQIKETAVAVGALNTSMNSLNVNARTMRDSMASTFATGVTAAGGFTVKMVELSTAAEDFGKALKANKLTMREYFAEAVKGYTRQNSLMKQLARDQVRYQESIAVAMGKNKSGKGSGMLMIPDEIDITRATTKMKLMNEQFSIFRHLVTRGSDELVNFGKQTQWTGRQLTVGLTMPVVLMGATFSKTFAAIDRELTRFAKVYGQDLVTSNKQATESMKRQVVELAKVISSQYGIAMQETAALAADIAATGAEGQKLLETITQTSRLAVLGEVDRQEAMKATLAIQTAFKQNTNELADSINFLNAVENQTSTTLNDLVDAIPKAGPVIKGLGGSIKDLSVLMVAMKEGGIPAAEAANAIKSGMASLINPTKKASDTARQFGVDLEGIVKTNKGQLMPTLFAVQKALDGLDSFSKSRVIEEIFGKYQFARISALFNNLGKAGSQTQQAMKLAGASTASLAAIASNELKAYTESTAVRFQRMVESLKNTLMPIGETLLKALIPILEKVNGFITSISGFFNNLPTPIKNFGATLGALALIAGPILMLAGLFKQLVGNGLKFAMGIGTLGAKLAGLKTDKLEILDDTTAAAKVSVDNLNKSLDTQVDVFGRLLGMVNLYNEAMIRTMSMNPNYFVPFTPRPAGQSAPTQSTQTTPTPAQPVGGMPSFLSEQIKRQDGGPIPGYGGGDIVPALLEPGEFVVNKEATKKNYGTLNTINSGGMIRKYQDGGLVSVREALAPFFTPESFMTGKSAQERMMMRDHTDLDRISMRLYGRPVDAFMQDVEVLDKLNDELKKERRAGISAERTIGNWPSEKHPEGITTGLSNLGWAQGDTKIQEYNPEFLRQYFAKYYPDVSMKDTIPIYRGMTSSDRGMVTGWLDDKRGITERQKKGEPLTREDYSNLERDFTDPLDYWKSTERWNSGIGEGGFAHWTSNLQVAKGFASQGRDVENAGVVLKINPTIEDSLFGKWMTNNVMGMGGENNSAFWNQEWATMLLYDKIPQNIKDSTSILKTLSPSDTLSLDFVIPEKGSAKSNSQTFALALTEEAMLATNGQNLNKLVDRKKYKEYAQGRDPLKSPDGYEGAAYDFWLPIIDENTRKWNDDLFMPPKNIVEKYYMNEVNEILNKQTTPITEDNRLYGIRRVSDQIVKPMQQYYAKAMPYIAKMAMGGLIPHFDGGGILGSNKEFGFNVSGPFGDFEEQRSKTILGVPETPAQGITPGGWFRGLDNRRRYVKEGNEGHSYSEAFIAALFKELGIPVPQPLLIRSGREHISMRPEDMGLPSRPDAFFDPNSRDYQIIYPGKLLHTSEEIPNLGTRWASSSQASDRWKSELVAQGGMAGAIDHWLQLGDMHEGNVLLAEAGQFDPNNPTPVRLDFGANLFYGATGSKVGKPSELIEPAGRVRTGTYRNLSIDEAKAQTIALRDAISAKGGVQALIRSVVSQIEQSSGVVLENESDVAEILTERLIRILNNEGVELDPTLEEYNANKVAVAEAAVTSYLSDLRNPKLSMQEKLQIVSQGDERLRAILATDPTTDPELLWEVLGFIEHDFAAKINERKTLVDLALHPRIEEMPRPITDPDDLHIYKGASNFHIIHDAKSGKAYGTTTAPYYTIADHLLTYAHLRPEIFEALASNTALSRSFRLQIKDVRESIAYAEQRRAEHAAKQAAQLNFATGGLIKGYANAGPVVPPILDPRQFEMQIGMADLTERHRQASETAFGGILTGGSAGITTGGWFLGADNIERYIKGGQTGRSTLGSTPGSLVAEALLAKLYREFGVNAPDPLLIKVPERMSGGIGLNGRHIGKPIGSLAPYGSQINEDDDRGGSSPEAAMMPSDLTYATEKMPSIDRATITGEDISAARFKLGTEGGIASALDAWLGLGDQQEHNIFFRQAADSMEAPTPMRIDFGANAFYSQGERRSDPTSTGGLQEHQIAGFPFDQDEQVKQVEKLRDLVVERGGVKAVMDKVLDDIQEKTGVSVSNRDELTAIMLERFGKLMDKEGVELDPTTAEFMESTKKAREKLLQDKIEGIRNVENVDELFKILHGVPSNPELIIEAVKSPAMADNDAAKKMRLYITTVLSRVWEAAGKTKVDAYMALLNNSAFNSPSVALEMMAASLSPEVGSAVFNHPRFTEWSQDPEFKLELARRANAIGISPDTNLEQLNFATGGIIPGFEEGGKVGDLLSWDDNITAFSTIHGYMPKDSQYVTLGYNKDLNQLFGAFAADPNIPEYARVTKAKPFELRKSQPEKPVTTRQEKNGTDRDQEELNPSFRTSRFEIPGISGRLRSEGWLTSSNGLSGQAGLYAGAP